ncbi:FAD/NAD(P)-binding domain-containing protein [Saccharata proteae CBS 121410]|uniref:FAD/NAD(P)-binding domain-containing protein n=1 Tax=Saccharata proteae CBS 121410 TaxID=1314787 RepID=A0A9P4HRY3_9PEZI|nr:FAD/NAD(P)-binding domain-containing protein [Saccharata proteae CBS 121410]
MSSAPPSTFSWPSSPPPPPKTQEQTIRDPSTKLDILIIGAGLGGLGTAISLLLAGHSVLILESAASLTEIGAGIQCLPNSTRILKRWGLEPHLEPHLTRPRRCNLRGWKGEVISSMDFWEYEGVLGTPFWDFHRAGLQGALVGRVEELGGRVRTGCRVVDVQAEVVLQSGERIRADLVIGADGINSKCREILLGRKDPPIPTGDLAYRLLLKTEEMMKDPELRRFVEDPQVNYWMGPDAHAVNYVLRGGQLFNMVLLVPDDMPAGATTLEGNVSEMRALFRDWDPRIPKLLSLCDSVYKWRLCIRPDLSPSWSHPSGTFTMLGDAVHATLPYLASGAGMSLEDAAVLGECLGRVRGRGRGEKMRALAVYEGCRRGRTGRVVQRGNLQQELYHLHDGAEQRERDRVMRAWGSVGERVKGGEDVGTVVEEMGLERESDTLPWRFGGVGSWLLTYDAKEDVERNWGSLNDTKTWLVQSSTVELNHDQFWSLPVVHVVHMAEYLFLNHVSTNHHM